MRRLRHFGSHLITSRYPVSDLLRYAVLLDKINYDLLTIGDHTLIPDAYAPYPNAHTLLASFAVLTKRIKLATAVTDTFRRHPVEIAQALATLDQISGGRRAVLGIGAGEAMNLAPFGVAWTHPLTRLREAIETIRLLWSATPDSPVNYNGKTFRFRNAYLQSRPEMVPPVYIGAAGKLTRELAGELGDGWIAIADESPSTLRLHLEDLWRGLQKSKRGKEPKDIDVVVTVYTAISEDAEEAYRQVEMPTKMQLIQERSVLRALSGIEIPSELSFQRLDASSKETLTRIKESASAVPRKLVEEVALFGTAEDCIARVEDFLESGATSILMCDVSNEPERVFEVIGRQIIPYLRSNYGGEETAI